AVPLPTLQPRRQGRPSCWCTLEADCAPAALAICARPRHKASGCASAQRRPGRSSMSVFQKIFGDPNDKEIKRLLPLVEAIGALEPEMEALSDDELRAKTDEF